VNSRDRDFRPSRRRGFDDDNFETPRRSFGAASGSNAQRFEAPSGPSIQAVVKWFNSDKGFGFVQLADGSGDAFRYYTANIVATFSPSSASLKGFGSSGTPETPPLRAPTSPVISSVFKPRRRWHASRINSRPFISGIA
jgi:hypothetical protein